MKALSACVSALVAVSTVFLGQLASAATLEEYVLPIGRVGVTTTTGVSGWALVCITDNPLIGIARRPVVPIQGNDGRSHIDLTMSPNSDPNHRFQYRIDIDLSGSGSDLFLKKFDATLVDTAAVQPLAMPNLTARLAAHSATIQQGLAMPRGSFAVVSAGGSPVSMLSCSVQHQ